MRWASVSAVSGEGKQAAKHVLLASLAVSCLNCPGEEELGGAWRRFDVDLEEEEVEKMKWQRPGAVSQGACGQYKWSGSGLQKREEGRRTLGSGGCARQPLS